VKSDLPSYDPQEGMCNERVFSPKKIRVVTIEHKEKRTWAEAKEGDLKLVLKDANGQTWKSKEHA